MYSYREDFRMITSSGIPTPHKPWPKPDVPVPAPVPNEPEEVAGDDESSS